VARVRMRYVAAGLDAAIYRKPPARQYRRRLDGEQEAHLVALTCSAPPQGHKRWTLRLLADRLVELAVVESVSYETSARPCSKPAHAVADESAGASRPSRMPSSAGTWRTCLGSPPGPDDPRRPQVWLDETSRQLLGEVTRPARWPRAGRPDTIRSTSGGAYATCSWSVSRLLAGDR